MRRYEHPERDALGAGREHSTASPSPGFAPTTRRPAWIEQALHQTGILSVRHRRLPAQQVVWLILAMALLADRSIPSVLSHLHLYSKNPGTPFDQPPAPSAIVRARDRLGEAPLRSLSPRPGSWLGLSSRRRLRRLSIVLPRPWQRRSNKPRCACLVFAARKLGSASRRLEFATG